eukprot:TRINITY_DN22623_c0_g1_i2.p1 TRINITY_DN22623_c0_g1~~TRINITY_DN22623_c0_g1_i2.p1  ORF type:complete len:184 (-),score=19.58 TRINITY_DN22623_c0_g1_i2:56-607(-)
MRSWGHGGLFNKKFWDIIRKEGLMPALLRGKIMRNIGQDKAGFGEDVVRCVGTDRFGNKYFEDFGNYGSNQRRWVEYSDHKSNWFFFARRLEPGWNGWLHYTYEEPPKPENFVEPFYTPAKSWILNGDHPQGFLNPGDLKNPGKAEYMDMVRSRVYKEWRPETMETEDVAGRKKHQQTNYIDY